MVWPFQELVAAVTSVSNLARREASYLRDNQPTLAAAQLVGLADPGGSFDAGQKHTRVRVRVRAHSLARRFGAPGGHRVRASGDDDHGRRAGTRPRAHTGRAAAPARLLPPPGVALAADHGRSAHASPRQCARGVREEAQRLEPVHHQRASPGAAPSPPTAVAVHSPLRGGLAGPESTLLRGPADGRSIPEDVRRRGLPPQGHRRSLDAPRADVDSRASAPQRPGVLPLAEYGALLRLDLVAQRRRSTFCVLSTRASSRLSTSSTFSTSSSVSSRTANKAR